jgi:hypothetical protein
MSSCPGYSVFSLMQSTGEILNGIFIWLLTLSYLEFQFDFFKISISLYLYWIPFMFFIVLFHSALFFWVFLELIQAFICVFFNFIDHSFFFLVNLGFELRASWWQSRHSTSCSTLPDFFCDGYFWDRVSQTICPGWTWTIILLISASWLAKITGQV